MSIDLGNKGRGVFYLNFRKEGNGENSASSTQEFNFGNLIETSGSYVVAIERLILPIHTIPMIPALIPALIFIPTNINNIQFVINTDVAYSWKEFMDDINNQLSEIPNIGTKISLNQSGRVLIESDIWQDYNIQFNDVLRDIFHLPQVIGINDANADDQVIGETSLLDRFDQLHKIQIEALGMNLQQEIIDTDRSSPILTDFIAPNSFSFGYDDDLVAGQPPSRPEINIGYSTRQNIIYTASSERRYVMLRGNTPIQNITIQCVAIYKDNTRNEIILPPRSVFEVKLAFFKR